MLLGVLSSLLLLAAKVVLGSAVAPQPAEPIGINWLVIVLLIAIVFLWSPKKIPELARSLGQAKKEFDSAMRDVSTAASTPQQSMPPHDTQLVNTAKRLGIATEGKSAEQLSQEIVSKADSR